MERYAQFLYFPDAQYFWHCKFTTKFSFLTNTSYVLLPNIISGHISYIELDGIILNNPVMIDVPVI
jgi:hypothetical protein